ncbi:MAG: GspH/FimT family protein [Thalassotalea sp.]|nr:GspH/FimT family protein [Thalassotalea sp.]MDG2392494.1 GspH/FimT family protein [Thalassotalea sp.]
MKNIKGLTLIEVLITILIISILAGVAGPSFLRSFETRKLVSATEQLYSNLQLARSESLARSSNIYVRLTGSGSNSWRYGISETSNCDPSLSNSNDAACYLVVDDGDGNIVAGDDHVLHTTDGADHKDITIALDFPDMVNEEITFNPMNGTSSLSGSFVLTNSLGDTATVKLSKLGTAKICSNDIGGYKNCS